MTRKGHKIACDIWIWTDYNLKSNQVKALLRTKVLNDVRAALFWVSFFTAGIWEKDTENGAAVTSLRTFVRISAFSEELTKRIIWTEFRRKMSHPGGYDRYSFHSSYQSETNIIKHLHGIFRFPSIMTIQHFFPKSSMEVLTIFLGWLIWWNLLIFIFWIVKVLLLQFADVVSDHVLNFSWNYLF